MSNGNLECVLSDVSLDLIKYHGSIDVKLVEDGRFLNVRGHDEIRTFSFSDSYSYYNKTIFPEFSTSCQTIEFIGFSKEAAERLWRQFWSEEYNEKKAEYERSCYNNKGDKKPFSRS